VDVLLLADESLVVRHVSDRARFVLGRAVRMVGQSGLALSRA
jgi:hypothetical protein